MGKLVDLKKYIRSKKQTIIDGRFFEFLFYTYEAETVYKVACNNADKIMDVETFEGFAVFNLKFSFKIINKEIAKGKYDNEVEINILTHFLEIVPLINAFEEETECIDNYSKKEIKTMKDILKRLKQAKKDYAEEIFSFAPTKLSLQSMLVDWTEINKLYDTTDN